MPNYDWKCRNCGITFERVTPFDRTITDCPKCLYGGAAVRLPSAPAFTVQGGTPKFHDKGRT